MLAILTPISTYPAGAARLILLGVGIGLVVIRGQIAAPDGQIGVTSPVILTARGVGGALGGEAFGALLGLR